MAYLNDPFIAFQVPTVGEWNQLWENDEALRDGTGIASGTITPEKLLAGTGTSWPWQSWTPTWTNLTVSGSTVTAKYVQIGKTVHFHIRVVLGGGNAPTGGVTFTLPVDASSLYDTNATIGTAAMIDTGTSNFWGAVMWNSSTTATLRTLNAAGTYLIHASISGTIPHTWANTDVIAMSGTYEAA